MIVWRRRAQSARPTGLYITRKEHKSVRLYMLMSYTVKQLSSHLGSLREDDKLFSAFQGLSMLFSEQLTFYAEIGCVLFLTCHLVFTSLLIKNGFCICLGPVLTTIIYRTVEERTWDSICRECFFCYSHRTNFTLASGARVMYFGIYINFQTPAQLLLLLAILCDARVNRYYYSSFVRTPINMKYSAKWKLFKLLIYPRIVLIMPFKLYIMFPSSRPNFKINEIYWETRDFAGTAYTWPNIRTACFSYISIYK